MEAKKTKKASLEGLRGIFFECGLIVGLSFMIVAFNWPSSGEIGGILTDNAQVIEDEIDVPNIIEVTPPPPVEIAAPIVSDEMILVDNTMDISSTNLFNTEDNKTPVIEVAYVAKKEIEKEKILDDDVKYEIVEEKPMFMGGDANSFSKWVASKVVYPTIDQENHVQGRVILQFRIGPDGTLDNIKVLRSVSAGLDKEAIRVVSSCPKNAWTPGKQSNKPVGVIYTFPVNFVLSN